MLRNTFQYEILIKLVEILTDFLKKHTGSVHLVTDGWTAPFAYSYLGIIVVWLAQCRIWRATLEFIQYVLNLYHVCVTH
jgi:hypothetical protein